MMVQDKKLRGTKVFTTHLWGGRDYSCWDIKKQKFQPIENNQWITKLNRIILLGTVSNFMAAHQVVVEIFQSGPKWLTAQPTLPPRATSMKSNRCCFLTSHKCRSSQQINKPQKVVKVYSRVGPHQTSAPTTAHASVPKNKRKGGGETLHGWDLSMLAGTHTDQRKHFSAASDKPLNIRHSLLCRGRWGRTPSPQPAQQLPRVTQNDRQLNLLLSVILITSSSTVDDLNYSQQSFLLYTGDLSCWDHSGKTTARETHRCQLISELKHPQSLFSLADVDFVFRFPSNVSVLAIFIIMLFRSTQWHHVKGALWSLHRWTVFLFLTE